MHFEASLSFGLLLVSASVLSCSLFERHHDLSPEVVGVRGDSMTSSAATILDFTFGGEVIGADADARKVIVSQLMYVQGLLMTTERGNARIGDVQLGEIDAKPDGEKKRITYEATLAIAWPSGVTTPTSYELVLPRDATSFDAFNEKYEGRCGSGHGREVFWMDFDPKADGCSLDEADVRRSVARVSPSARATSGKYPEYDLVWGDDRLDVVAVFAVISSEGENDWSSIGARSFIENTQKKLGRASSVAHGRTSSVLSHTTVSGPVSIGGRAREVSVDVLVTPRLSSVDAGFDEVYDELSAKADLVLYSGHAGYGREIDALARKGKVLPGKYQIVLVNGCQTFAYVDGTMTDRRHAVNGETDPSGTRFLDVVTNALPNLTSDTAQVSSALFDAILQADAPKSYGEILRAMPDGQIPVVSGEEDNRYTP